MGGPAAQSLSPGPHPVTVPLPNRGRGLLDRGGRVEVGAVSFDDGIGLREACPRQDLEVWTASATGQPVWMS